MIIPTITIHIEQQPRSKRWAAWSMQHAGVCHGQTVRAVLTRLIERIETEEPNTLQLEIRAQPTDPMMEATV